MRGSSQPKDISSGHNGAAFSTFRLCHLVANSPHWYYDRLDSQYLIFIYELMLQYRNVYKTKITETRNYADAG